METTDVDIVMLPLFVVNWLMPEKNYPGKLYVTVSCHAIPSEIND